jgi:hypothetical protein
VVEAGEGGADVRRAAVAAVVPWKRDELATYGQYQDPHAVEHVVEVDGSSRFLRGPVRGSGDYHGSTVIFAVIAAFIMQHDRLIAGLPVAEPAREARVGESH